MIVKARTTPSHVLCVYDAGRDVATGEVGELVLRNPTVVRDARSSRPLSLSERAGASVVPSAG